MSIWTVLRLERTRDARTIRRAYAQQLKATNPEDDPEGFKALREAYEAALWYAEHGFAGLEDDYPEADKEEADEAPPRSPSPPPVAPDQNLAHLDDLFDLKTRVLALRDDPPADREALARAFAAIAAAPELENLDARDRFEHWLTWLLASEGLASERLIPAAIAAMGWREGGGGELADQIDALFALQGAAGFLKDLRMPRHPFHAGYQALQGPPPASSLVWFFRPSPLPAIREVMAGLEAHPQASAAFDHLHLWEDWLDRPRLSLTALWAAVISAPILGFLGWLLSPENGLAGFGLSALGGGLAVLALGAVHVLAVLWPRRLWREQWSWRLPEWLGAGWLAGVFALLLSAVVVPPSLPVMVVQGAVGLVLVWWCAITADIDRRESGYAWPVRMAILNAYVVLWLGVLAVFRPEVVLPLLPPLAAGLACAFLGSFTLAWLWGGRLGPGWRMAGAVLLLVLCVVAIAFLASVDAAPVLAGPVVAITALAVMASRVMADELDETPRRIRHYLCWFGLIGLGQLLRGLDGPVPFVLQIVTAWMLIGPVIVGFATLATTAGELTERQT